MIPNLLLIKDHFKESIDAYVATGRPTGGFLHAVLTNDLFEAIGRGDNDAIDNLPHIVAYLYNKTPFGCYGSKEVVANWHAQKRL